MEGDEIWNDLDFAGQRVGRPEWVLDDEYLVYFVNENRGSYLYMFQLETGETIRLTDKPLSGHGISRKGEKVVYLTTRPDSNLCVIYLRTLHETCFPDETPYSSGVPSWSH
jgi:Tol biopolymer transport system component